MKRIKIRRLRKKTNSFKVIKDWYFLTKPDKKSNILSVVFYVLFTIFYLSLSVLTAQVTDFLYAGNWILAFVFVGLSLFSILVRQVFSDQQYRNYAKVYGSVNRNLQTKIYNKILACQNKNFSQTSKEKIINIISDDVGVLADFHDTLTVKFCKLLRSIIPLVTIFVINYIVGFVILSICVINYFIFKYIGQKISETNKELKEARDGIFENISKSVDGQEIIREFGKEKEYRENYLEKIDVYNKKYKKKYIYTSVRESWFYGLWNIFVYIATFFLVYLVSQGSLSVGVYLIIFPYLTTCTENFNEVFKVSGDIHNARISMDRVNTILDFSERDLKKFGRAKNIVKNSNLSLIGVSYSSNEYSEYDGKIEDIDMSFIPKEINVIYGEQGCGKRIIFNILRRRIQPDKGVILLNNIDIYKYDKMGFKNNIYYVAGEPQFLSSSIYSNLSIVVKSKKKIFEVCKKVGVYDWIMNLPEKFDTVISRKFPKFRLFQLGLVRTLLTNCDIFMVYGFPKGITVSETKKLKEFFINLKKERTIIIFTHNEFFDDIAKMSYKIENGKVVNINVNKKEIVDIPQVQKEIEKESIKNF